MGALKHPAAMEVAQQDKSTKPLFIITDPMEKKAKRIATLLAGYMRETLTSTENDELDEWVGASDKNMRLFEELTDERRVTLALELLNDNGKSLTKRLVEDKGYTYVNPLLYHLKMLFLTLFSYFKR